MRAIQFITLTILLAFSGLKMFFTATIWNVKLISIIECQSDSTPHTTNPIAAVCKGVTCPNEELEGGLVAEGECSPYFCECYLGVPYRLTCEEPLVFNIDMGYCDWCYNMCDVCEECNECNLL